MLKRSLGLLLLVLVCFGLLSIPTNEQTAAAQSSLSFELADTLGAGRVLDIQWSPDEQWFGVLTARGVWLYPHDGLDEPPTLIGKDHAAQAATSFVFHPLRPEVIIGQADGTVAFWDVSLRREIGTLQGPQQMITDIAISPDGTRLATAENKHTNFDIQSSTIMLWDVQTTDLIKTISHTLRPGGMVFTEDSLITNFYTVSDGGYDVISEQWDLVDGTLERELPGLACGNIFISPELDKILGVGTCGGKWSYSIYGFGPEELPSVLPANTSQCWDSLATFVSQNKLLFPLCRGLFLFDLDTQELTEVDQLALDMVSLAATGEYLSVADRAGNIHHYDTTQKTLQNTTSIFQGPIQIVHAHQNRIWGLESFDKYLFPGNRPTKSALVEASYPSGNQRLTTVLSDVSTFKIEDGNRVFIGLTGGEMLVWSLDEMAEIYRWQAYNFESDNGTGLDNGLVQDVVLAPDGSQLMSLSNSGSIKFWQLDSSSVREVTPTHRHSIYNPLTVVYNPNGTLVVVGGSGGIAFWEPFAEILGYDAHLFGKTSLEPSPATIQADFTHGEYTTLVFRPGTATLYLAGFISYHGGWGSTGIYSLDAADVGTLDNISPDAYSHIDAHQLPINDLAFSPDGNLLISASDDNFVGVWSPDSGELLYELPMYGGTNDVEFSADGSTLFVAGEDGTIRVWQVTR